MTKSLMPSLVIMKIIRTSATIWTCFFRNLRNHFKNMLLERFLNQLVGGLDTRGVSHCILRNYEELPYQNVGSDIDLLIHSRDREKVKNLFHALKGPRITCYLERHYVISFYIHGIEWADGKKAIAIDFNLSLSWKGLPYLDVDNVLKSAVTGKARSDWIRTPSPEHEAIISFFSSYLVGGWINDRYQGFVKSTFESHRKKIKSILRTVFGKADSRDIVDLVIYDDRKKLLKFLPQFRRKLLVRSFLKAAIPSAKKFLKHYFIEFFIRYTFSIVYSVCILGPDGSGKTSVSQKLERTLEGTVKRVHLLHLKPWFFRKLTSQSPVIDPHGKPPRGVLISIINILAWGLELFLDQVAHGYKNCTLRIWDRYYHDMLVDPLRYRYGGPMWLARWVGKLIPKPDIWILLDAPPELLQKRKQEVPFEETARQRKEYLNLVKGMKNGIVIDASQDLDDVVADVNAAILKYMVERTEKHLKK